MLCNGRHVLIFKISGLLLFHLGYYKLRKVEVNVSVTEPKYQFCQLYWICVRYNLGELKSRGHVTITHQMLVSTFQAFCRLSLSRSDKLLGKFLQDFSWLFPKLVIFYFSFICKKYVSHKACSINFEPPDNDLCSACHVYPLSRGARIISILFILNRFTWYYILHNLMNIPNPLNFGVGTFQLSLSMKS